MAPSRKSVSGRSPLVNKQHQITAFFSKATAANPNPKNPSPTSSPPTTPSPINAKTKPKTVTPPPTKTTQKPQLVIGTNVDPGKYYGEEVVGRRVRVYWPMDEEWYEGFVKRYDEKRVGDGKRHLVEYDDGEEEWLDLGKEKVEWVEGERKKLRRLRQVAVVLDSDSEVEEKDNVCDSSDEDWKGVVEVEEEEGLEGMELEEEGEEEGEKAGRLLKRKRGESGVGGRKGEGEKAGVEVSKKSKGGVSGVSEFFGKVGKEKVVGGSNEGQEVKPVAVANNVTNAEVLERFGNREEQKFSFLGKGRRDANRRCPSDPDYDPRTLYLPPHFLNNLTGGQKQWWEFKSKHMDKVLFFKMGKFYELFEMDAHIGAKELDLQYMKGEQPHCGFPEKNFSIHVEKLAKKGYRVLVVEQTETPDQMEIRRKQEGTKEKVVKREICAIVTKGTLTEGEMLSANPDASYIMSVIESCPTPSNKIEERFYGVCVVDVATSRVIIGKIKDDEECGALCCLLSELRPVEIIKPTKMLSLDTERALARHTRNPLVNELVPGVQYWDADRTVSELKNFYSRISEKDSTADAEYDIADGYLPDVLKELLTTDNDGLALSALGGTLYYLRQTFLDETLLRYAKFESLPCVGFRDVFQKPYMVLDAAALENLEIFENSRNGDASGTLYSQLNHCVTAFGKRLLKTWLARPLFHQGSIRERQEAIAGFKGDNLSAALEFRKELLKLPDMERLLVRLFASSEANGRNASKIILYEDAAKKQLQEFISTLRGCEVMFLACTSLGTILESNESVLLHHLLTPGKGLPDVTFILKQFRDGFDWAEAISSGRIIPHEGVDTEYDFASKRIEEITFELEKHLKEQKKLLGASSIKYVNLGKDSYILEVPESLQASIPSDYELQSSKKGFYRYWTPFTKEMVGELKQVESLKESRLKCMLHHLMGQFCEHHTKWRLLLTTVAELDVLISLVIASDYYEGPTCRPTISTAAEPKEMPRLVAKSLGHPVIKSDSLGKGTFVPNNINIGGSNQSTFILLTGPNMGGKSTLLRQICFAVILAQIGADVPAEHFELSLVDRIFVRMGAKDHIMAGQSTFLTELCETASVLTSATRDSLVALDELGRGTSTSDGQAIAESVLEHLVHEVECRGMFSTHYHRLAVDYKRDPKVSLCHMACQVGKNDEGLEEVTFLYRLTPGACPKSYGVNVARLAGLPDSVLHKAAAKSREFEAAYSKKQEVSKNDSSVPWEEKAASFIQDLAGIYSDNISQKVASNTIMTSLMQLHHKATVLIEQC